MGRKASIGLFTVCCASALALAACGGTTDTNVIPLPNGSGPTLGNEPVLMSPAVLRQEAQLLGQPIYWAGPRKGREYEFQGTSKGYAYVRYLPPGSLAGDPGKFLTIGTYPYAGAFKGVKRDAKGHAFAGPHRSIVYIGPNPTSVFIAFHKVDYEIEIYDPNPRVAIRTALSGDVRPIR